MVSGYCKSTRLLHRIDSYLNVLFVIYRSLTLRFSV